MCYGMQQAQTVPEMQVHWTQSQAPAVGKECGITTSSKRSDRTVVLCHQSIEVLKIKPQWDVKGGELQIWETVKNKNKKPHYDEIGQIKPVYAVEQLFTMCMNINHWPLVNDSPRCSVTPRKRTRLQRKNKAPMTRAEVRKAFCWWPKYTH